MKILLTARLTVLVVWPLTVAPSAPANSEQERPYLIIEETTSPNGQYAVAWTLPKGPQIDWEKFRGGERGSDSLPDLAGRLARRSSRAKSRSERVLNG